MTAAVWFLVRGVRGRPHALARAVGRLRRPRLRGQDGRGAAGRARDRRGVAVGRAARPAGGGAPARAGRRGDGRRRAGLAGAGVADPGLGPAVDLGHERQQHLVADLRLQRPRPAGRAAGRRPAAAGSRAAVEAEAPSAATRACCDCSTRASAGRAAGCSASRWWPGSASCGVTRLRRDDPRTGWLIAVGGVFLTIAVAFSQASGIFHPYYVSQLAPFTAALVGAGIGVVAAGGLPARVVGPLAIGAGIVTSWWCWATTRASSSGCRRC